MSGATESMRRILPGLNYSVNKTRIKLLQSPVGDHDHPLLATKLLALAPLPRSAERHRFAQRLDVGLQGKLTLVCAPAGFGKSSLVGAWVQACEYPSAWLSLEEEERDPKRSVAFLTAGLRSVAAHLGEAALALAQVHPRPAPEWAEAAQHRKCDLLRQDAALVRMDRWQVRGCGFIRNRTVVSELVAQLDARLLLEGGFVPRRKRHPQPL